MKFISSPKISSIISPFTIKTINLSFIFIRNYSHSLGELTDFQKEAIIGLILGDLHISKVKTTHNARLMFVQGIKNSDYLIHLYELFSEYCLCTPKVRCRPDKRTNKTYYSAVFTTRMLPVFNYYHSLFYMDRGVKAIPSDIGNLLTPIGLAYWAMDDGCKHRKNFYLNTDSFTLEDTLLLIKVLKDNFDLNCTYQVKRKGQYRIYIKRNSIEKFKTLVTPYFHRSLLYKLEFSY